MGITILPKKFYDAFNSLEDKLAETLTVQLSGSYIANKKLSVQVKKDGAYRYERLILGSDTVRHLLLEGGETGASIDVVGEVYFRVDGGIPTSENGHLLKDGDFLEIDSHENLSRFKAISKGDQAELKITFYGDTKSVVTPDSVSGLSLHLDATQTDNVDGERVSVWEDLSGKGNDAVQETARRRLTYRENYRDLGVPGLVFHTSGSGWMQVNGGSFGNTRLFMGAGDEFTVFVVAIVRVGTSGSLISKTESLIASRQLQLLYDAGSNPTASPAVWARGIITRTDLRLYSEMPQVQCITWDGTKGSHFSKRGEVSLKVGNTDEISHDAPLYIGTRDAGRFTMDSGAINEVLIFDRCLSNYERGGIEKYLNEKWVL